jgi:hypothetical protein
VLGSELLEPGGQVRLVRSRRLRFLWWRQGISFSGSLRVCRVDFEPEAVQGRPHRSVVAARQLTGMNGPVCWLITASILAAPRVVKSTKAGVGPCDLVGSVLTNPRAGVCGASRAPPAKRWAGSHTNRP